VPARSRRTRRGGVRSTDTPEHTSLTACLRTQGLFNTDFLSHGPAWRIPYPSLHPSAPSAIPTQGHPGERRMGRGPQAYQVRQPLRGSRLDLSIIRTRAAGGHGASTNAVYYHFTKRLSGVPGEALKRKLMKDISFALRRGTIAQVTTLALDGRARPARRRGRARRQ
jgi:hypothetical protein